MNKIQFITGDATKPPAGHPAIIVHICNDIGGWGAGFVLAVSKRWPEPERRFRQWYRGEEAMAPLFQLGEVQFVDVGDGITVANLIGQHGIHRQGNKTPIRYEAVEKGLSEVARKALETGASIHMPRIGCGLAGGRWEKIEPLITQELIGQGLSVTVYDFTSS